MSCRRSMPATASARRDGADLGAEDAEQRVDDREPLALVAAAVAARTEVGTAHRVAERGAPSAAATAASPQPFVGDGLDAGGVAALVRALAQRGVDAAWSRPNSARCARRSSSPAAIDEQQVLGLDFDGAPPDRLVDRAHHDVLQPWSIHRRSSMGSGIAPPQFDARGLEPPVMLLVHGLARDAERLGDLRPAPAGAHRALDGGVFETVGELTQRDDGGEVVGFGVRWDPGGAGSCKQPRLLVRVVNPSCSMSTDAPAWQRGHARRIGILTVPAPVGVIGGCPSTRISTDPVRLDRDRVHVWLVRARLLGEGSARAPRRTPRSTASLNFGVYDTAPEPRSATRASSPIASRSRGSAT